MKVLFIANPESIYIRKLLENLEMYDLDYEVYCCGKFLKRNFQCKKLSERLLVNNKVGKIIKFFYFKKCLMNFKEINEYDLIHIHLLDWQSLLFKRIYNEKKLIVTFWGSDLYRLPRSKIYKFLQKSILKKADFITVAHEKMIKEFYKTYNIAKPVYVTPFPVPTDFRKIDRISGVEIEKYKEKLGAKGLIIVTLGYSGDPGKNHKYMIEEVGKIKENLKKKIFAVVPMTYGGSKEYIEMVKEYCNEKLEGKIKYKILTKKLDEDEVLLLRKATDIFVNVQISDVCSASMQESLYAENVVINGKWLDYSEIQEQGGYFETIESLEEGKLKEKLEYVINNLENLKEKTKVNKAIISNRNDWKKATEAFLKIYKKAMNTPKKY